jgi:hypothetical protein
MKYPKNDLWSVRQVEFLYDALEGYETKTAIYYPDKTTSLEIPDIESYDFLGVLHFPGQDRTIVFEQGNGYGLKQEEIITSLKLKKIVFELR